MIDRVFPSRLAATSRTRRIRDRGGRRRPLDIQRLEERIALAIDLFQYPIAGVTSGSSSYAILVMDDGTNGFFKKNATPSPSFTYATNSRFLDDPTTLALEAIDLAELPGAFGPLNTIYVTSGIRQTYAGATLRATTPGTTTTFRNMPVGGVKPIDLGTSDGIVPGTFRASLSVVDSAGNAATARLLASKPGDRWNLSIERVSGDGALPTDCRIFEPTGDVTLSGWSDAPQSVSLTPIDWAVYTGLPNDAKPLSFTVSPGQTITQRMLVDLSRDESTITFNSPVLSTRGDAGDPNFFAGAGGVAGQVGQVVLDGATIVTNANVSSSNLFTIGVPMWINTIRIPVDNVAINRPVAAPRFQSIVEGAVGSPGRLLVGEQGALANSLTAPATNAAASLDIQAIHADVVLAGTVNAAQQTHLLQSPLDPRAYTLTTVSPTTGVQTGRILGDTVGVTLANDAGGEVNIRTTIDTLRMTASSTPSTPALPYAITVTEADDLTIDAVPASQRPITIDVAGLLNLASSVETTGSLSLSARNQLSLAGAVSSAAGSVSLTSDSIVASTAITSGGMRDVVLQSRSVTGDVAINGLVRAGGTVKSPVRAATTANVGLATGGLSMIDGVTLVAGDRVLVKNQTVTAENGLYVASAGAWIRATDANTAQLLVPGFSVAVREGAQKGAWTFANASVPTIGQTGLAFVPASATQTYVPVRVATPTGVNINLAVGGLFPLDGVNLVADDRVLVMNQANPRQNGLYIAGTGAWVRAADADTVGELVAGSYVFVTEGTTKGGKGFVLKDDAVQVGNTPLAFESFAVESNRTTTYSPANVLASVVAATTVNIDLGTPPAEIDGISLGTGDLVLVKNQFDAAANGVYVYDDSAGLTRWSGVDSGGELPRGSIVFVEQGATNAGSSWTFNDTVNLLGRTTAGSLQVTGLASTQYLATGMLVSGPGIPSDTKIDIVIDGTSVRLTKPARTTSTTAPLGFMQTSAVSAVSVGTTPILFVPTGGTVAITAGRSISSNNASPTSRITAGVALLSAGRPESGTADASSLIAVNSAVGRLTAVAPASVGVSDSGAIDLFDIRSLGGAVAVDAQGTVTARSVSAVGTSTNPADVTLGSLFGDVVAAAVGSSIGTISLNSTNGQVIVRRVGLNAATVRAQDGDVVAVADVGGIRLEGPVQAAGADGDVTLQSVKSGLQLVAPGSIQASDRLTVVTPGSAPTFGPGTSVSATGLSITSPFGKAEGPPAGFGTFSRLNVNRTDAGNIDISSLSSLTVEGASTVNGSILFTSPSISVVGPVTAGTDTAGDGDVTLTATTGAITLAADVTARNDTVRLVATKGAITQTAGAIDCTTFVWTAPSAPTLLPGNSFTNVGINLTAPGDVRIPTTGTQSGTLTLGRVTTVNGNVVIDAESVVIADLVQAGGTGKTVSVTARGGTIAFVNTGRIDQSAATAGAVTLSAAGAITSTTGATTVLSASGLTLSAGATTALRTAVNSLSATLTSGDLDITEADALVLASVTARDIRVRTSGGLTQTGVITGRLLDVGAGSLGDVILDTSANRIDTLTATNAGRSVRFTDADGFAVEGLGIAGSPVVLKTQAGDLAVNAPIVATGGQVTLDAGQGLITQAGGGPITSQGLVWFSGAQPVLAAANSFTAIGINLTKAGNVIYAHPAGSALQLVGATTADGNVTISADSIAISDLVRAGGTGGTVTSVTATVGNVSFVGSGRVESQSGPITLAAPVGTVLLVNGGTLPVVTSAAGLTVTTSGSVPVGRVEAAGTILISTLGDVTVGPQPSGLLKSNTSIDLRSVAGTVSVANGGQIVAPSVLLAPGKIIQIGDAQNVASAAALNAVIASINALPVIPGARYEIVITASFPLTQTLTINRPVLVSGTSTAIVMSGNSTVRTGLALGANASGSIVRNIAFANFADTAIRLTNNTGTAITGLIVRDCGTGLLVTGTSTGTVVRSNRFNRIVTGIRLVSATGVTIGGSAAGQGNTIANASQQGVLAQGFCTGSRVIRNTITSTRIPYNIAGSRNLTVVR